MNNSTIIEALKALRYVQAMTGESSKGMEEAIEELEKDLEVSGEVAPSNPTNEEIIEELKESLEKVCNFDLIKDPLVRRIAQELLQDCSIVSIKSMKEALQAKDEQARREKIELVESVPLSLGKLEFFDPSDPGKWGTKYLEWIEAKVKGWDRLGQIIHKWKADKLTQLKK